MWCCRRQRGGRLGRIGRLRRQRRGWGKWNFLSIGQNGVLKNHEKNETAIAVEAYIDQTLR